MDFISLFIEIMPIEANPNFTSQILSMDPPLAIKLVVLGSEGVGKTTALHRLASGCFDDNALPTIAVQMQPLDLVSACGHRVTVSLVDTAGQERHRAVTPQYLRDARFILLCYAVHDRQGFHDLARWHAMARDHAPAAALIVAALQSDRDLAVERSEGARFAGEINAPFIEMSSLTGFGFQQLRAEIQQAADERGVVGSAIEVKSGGGACC
jgi:small GTP-binding protein